MHAGSRDADERRPFSTTESRWCPQTFERIAYVPERSVLYDWMTVDEHVEMKRRAFALSIRRAPSSCSHSFNIDRASARGTLSKGMRTAVMVAIAFARNAEILILDEPTGGLDPINQRTRPQPDHQRGGERATR